MLRVREWGTRTIVGRRILGINEAERAWIADNQQVVGRFAVTLGILTDPTLPLDPRVLDEAWAGFLERHVRGQEDPISIINAFGIAFGVYIADRIGLEWRLVSDVVTEIALCREADGVVIYPQNLVARQYMAGTTRFFEALAAEMEQTHGLRSGLQGALAGARIEPAEPAAVDTAAGTGPAIEAPDATAVLPSMPSAPATRKAASSKSAAPKVSAVKGVGPGKDGKPGQAVGLGRPARPRKSAGPGEPVGPGRPETIADKAETPVDPPKPAVSA
jgi:hypothetical protein